ncbi:MAG TPA: mycofactocin-associated electron transfer flavoprotein beta subunit [Acidimicrobiales bacterium]|nr:mycofactocin-associated electron transfer flavoprotein beta subunit [Acidimicrobiales bacterium]
MSSTADLDVLVVACLKAVPLVSSVDQLSGEVSFDPMSLGASVADLAALEWALRCGEAWGRPVLAVSAGGPEADAVLRDALAAGASAAVRVDVEREVPSSDVAAAIASTLTRRGGAADCVVFTGDASLDRGSGSVPAFLAAELCAAQALGLVALEVGPDDLTVERRLDGGRREILRVAPPAVVSVEGGSARLRRAALPAAIESARADIESVSMSNVRSSPVGSGGPIGSVGWVGSVGVVDVVEVRPYRPRASAVPPPEGLAARQRIMALTGTARQQPTSRILELEPAAAADELLATLRSWGELP